MNTILIELVSTDNGLSVYSVGAGAPVLLFPYPHAHTTTPMAQSPLAEILTGMGRTQSGPDRQHVRFSGCDPLGRSGRLFQSSEP